MTAAKMPSTNAAGTSRVWMLGSGTSSRASSAHSRAEVHDHDDACAIISRDDGLRYGGRVGAQMLI